MTIDAPTFEIWLPVSDIPPDLIVEAVLDDHAGFRIHVKGEAPVSRVPCLDFDPVLSYRALDESMLLKFGRTDRGSLNRYGLFLVSNSEYLNWFHAVSQGLRANAKHYAIHLSNQCIDVIADFEPAVDWL